MGTISITVDPWLATNPMATEVNQQRSAQQLLVKANEQGVEPLGPTEIDVPRDDGSTFDPQTILRNGSGG